MPSILTPAGYWQHGGMILKLLVVLCLMVLQPLVVTGKYGMQTCEDEAEIDDISDAIELDIDCYGSGNVVVSWTFKEFLNINAVIIGHLCYTDPQDVDNPCLYSVVDENSSTTKYSTTTSKTNCIAKGCFKVKISRNDYIWASINNASCYFDDTNHQVVHNQSSEVLPPAACITTTTTMSSYSIHSSVAISSNSTIIPSITSPAYYNVSGSSTIKPSITPSAYHTVSGSATSTVRASNQVTTLTVSTAVSTSTTVDPQNPFNLDPTTMTIISIIGYVFGVIGLVSCCCACIYWLSVTVFYVPLLLLVISIIGYVFGVIGLVSCCCACIMAIWCGIVAKKKRKSGLYEAEQLPDPIADQEDSLCNSIELKKTVDISHEMT